MLGGAVWMICVFGGWVGLFCFGMCLGLMLMGLVWVILFCLVLVGVDCF